MEADAWDSQLVKRERERDRGRDTVSIKMNMAVETIITTAIQIILFSNTKKDSFLLHLMQDTECIHFYNKKQGVLET